MIAVDTSSWVAFLAGEEGEDVSLVERALADGQVCLAPVVLTELLSDAKLPKHIETLLLDVPQLELLAGYWQRAGTLRARVLARGLKARLADTLIAQSCLDHDVPLITRDSDFRHFSGHGLKVL